MSELYERHISAAIELVDSDMFKGLMTVGRIGKCAELIARALAEVEREGMRRAAETVKAHGAQRHRWVSRAAVLDTILSEAGEGE